MLDTLISMLLAMALIFTGTPSETDEVRKGSRVTFGSWPQSRYEDQNGNIVFPHEPLVWQVLAIEGDDALIITEKAIDAQQYNSDFEDIRWENCSLRTWLNNEFLKDAFSERQRRHIRLTDVVNGTQSSFYEPEQGADTQDYVFLLSPADFKQYYANYNPWDENVGPRAQATVYATTHGSIIDYRNSNARYWVRSTGPSSGTNASYMSGWGNLEGGPVTDIRGVRPAIWVDVRALDLATEDGASRVSWLSWIVSDDKDSGDSDSGKSEDGITATVTAQTVCIRDASGNPMYYLDNGSRLKVTGYNTELESFVVEYKGETGYIKGIGLNYSPEELKSMLDD